MTLKLKKRISPDTAKFFSTFGVSIAVILIVFFLMSSVMKRTLRNSEKQYLENCNQVVEGYSLAIQQYLENYHTSLLSIFNKELFKTGDTKCIHKWIIDNVPFVHKDFCSTFYVDENYTGYFSEGWVINLKGREYLSEHNFDNTDYHVSDMIHSEYTSFPIFIIQVPYFDDTHKLRGILCASIKFTSLGKLADEVKIGEQSTAYIQDRKGVLLDHPDSPYFGKVFIPETEKYSHITSEIISAATESGIVEVENYLREPIDLIYTKIKNCGWTLAVGFPKKYLDKIYNQQRIIKFLILIISVVALSLLMLLELSISDYFYKNQLIEADYNSISNLWTRQKFEKEAQKLLEHHPHSRFMMIESDIKGFKFVNQSYGEESANNMLFFYSKMINKISLEFNGIVGHGYADHFYTLIQVHDLRAAMYKFREKMKEVDDFIKEYEIPFFPKFGVTFCKPSRTPDITIKELIGQTSFVKSTVKDNMLIPYSVYNFTLLNKLKEEQLIESRMESALQNEEFFLMYQPKISLKTDKIVGAEALVRWKTSDSGMFMPDKFIPLFEKNGFIIKLDFYVYEQVFKFIDSQLKAGKKVVPVSVNMSRNHSKPERFMETFMSLFRKYEIPPHLIQIEIIERSFMDSETLCDITNRLHREGFTVAMDDFGSGESSLNMLTKVPVDVLKFDREFLISSTRNDGEMDEKSANFITSLINLSRQLEKETVFEGVETVIQRDFLRKINCDQVQGYFYSRPLLEKDFVEFMNIHL